MSVLRENGYSARRAEEGLAEWRAKGWLGREAYGLRPEPFYLGIAVAVAGLAMSLLFVRETQHHVAFEAQDSSRSGTDERREGLGSEMSSPA